MMRMFCGYVVTVIPQWVLVVCCMIAIPARTAMGQDDDPPSRTSVIVANVAIGAAIGGISQAVQKKSVIRGLLLGATGGATVYLGKCIVAQRTGPTDWIGRNVVAAGSSIVANAAAGRPAFQTIAIPVGPARVYYDDKRKRARIKVDLSQLAVATYFGFRNDTHWNPDLTLKHGVLIFDNDGERSHEAAGVIRTPNADKLTLAHEQIHVVQHEFLSVVIQEPFERAVLAEIPGGKTVHKYVDIGLMMPMWGALNLLIDYKSRPWEKEAFHFQSGC